MQKIKRKGVLLSLIAAFALCFGVRKVDAEADAPPLTSANFTALCGDLAGATTLEELIPAAKNGTAVDGFHKRDEVTLSFGGKEWTAVYLSESVHGDILLTLWLSPQEETPTLRWSDCRERNPSPDSDFPSNLYSFSFIRSYLCGTPYKDPTEQITSNSAQDETWADFLRDFGDYLAAPEEVPYQETQSARALFEKPFDLLNESYGDQSLEYNYSTKEGYTDWKEDKLFLPSVSEIGESPHTGIWKTSEAQRTTDENNFYWLRSAEVKEERSHSYSLEAYYVSGAESLCNSVDGNSIAFGVRPAIHLNLTKVAPTESSPDLPNKPEGGMLHAEKEYDGTPLSLPIAHADLLSVSSMTDGADFTLSKDGTGTFSAVNAGAYELSLLPKDGTWSDGTKEPAVYTLFISRAQKTLTAKWTVCDEASEDDGKFLFTGMKEYSAHAIYNGKSLNEIPAECIQASLFDQDGNLHGELSFTLAKAGGKTIGEEMRISLELENTDKNVEWTVTEASKRFSVDMIKRHVSIKLKTGLNSVYGEPLLRPETCFEYAEGSLKILETDGDALALTGIEERANAGEYEVQLALQAYAERYELTCEGGKYTVLRRKCDTGAVFALEKEYDGTTEAALDVSQLSLTGTVEGDDVNIHANGIFDEKNAGDRTVFVTLSLSGKDSDNYLLERYEYSLRARILPREITVEIGDASSIYGDATPEFSYRLAGGTVIAGDELLFEFSLDREAKSAGRYEISAVCGNPNYAVTFINGTYTIYKAQIEIPIIEDLIYNGEMQKVKVDEAIYTVEGSAKDVGEYEAVLQLKDSTNYEFATGEEEVRIQYKVLPYAVTVRIDDASSVYGKPIAKLGYTLMSPIFGDDDLGISLRMEGVNAGTYAISGTWKNQNYQVTFINGTYTIYKAQVEIPTVEDLVYNGTEQSVKVDETIFTVVGRAKDVGEYEAVLRLKDSTNYEFASGEEEVKVKYKILPYSVTVRINNASSVYGKPIAELGFTVLDKLFGDDDLGISLRMDGMNAGTYAITGKWTNQNYDVTFINGTYTIHKAQIEIPNVEDLVYNGTEQKIAVDESIYTVEGSAKNVGEYEAILRLKDSTNYEFTTGEAEVIVKYKILPYAVTVRIENASSVYNEPIAKLGYKLMSPIFGDDDLGISLRMDGVNAGTYAITGNWTNRNYQVTFINGTYTIYKAQIEIPTVEDLVYNGEEQKVKVDDSIFTVEGSVKDVGDYEAVLRLKDSTNYEFEIGETEIWIQYQILPYAVTVRIDDASSVYNEPIAKLGYTLMSPIFGDDDLGISLQMDGMNAGTYTITGIWTNQNYNVTFINGTYTIYKAKIDIPSIEDLIYNGEMQKVKVDETFFFIEGQAKNVGTYEAVLRLKDSENYEFTTGEEQIKVKYKILPYSVTVRIDDASSIYGKPIAKLGYAVLGTLFGDDDLGISLRMEGVNAGKYAITGTWTNHNYQVTFINGTYTIYKAKVEIPKVEDLVYNGTEQKIALDESIYIIEGCAKDVGEYNAILKLKDSENYEFTTGEETIKIKYKILPYAVTVRIKDASSSYGDPIAELEYILLDKLFGEDDLGISLQMNGVNAGTYAITGKWTNRNYQVTFINGTCTIHKAQVEIPTIEDLIYNGEEQKIEVDESIYTVEGSAKNVGEYEAILKLKDSENYEFTTGEETIKIKYKILPYSVTVKIDDASSSYGEPIAKLTYTLSNELFGNDDLNLFLYVKGMNAGTYKIEGTWKNKNYDVSFEGGIYTIHKAKIDIPTVEDLVYNGEAQKIKVDETVYTVEGRAKDVGEHEAIIKIKDSVNYEFETGAAEVKIKYKILPYAVTVQIENASSVYGEPLAKINYTILDEIFGDDDLGIELTVNGVNAGTYAIEGSWANQNYTVTFISGGYTIHKAQNNWADGFDLKTWLQSGDFSHLPSTKFGEVQIEIFLDASCTKKFEGDIASAPPGRYFLHFFVPQSENFEGFDEVVPFLVKFTDLLSDESSNTEPPYSDRANFPHFELMISAGALSFLLTAVYAAKARRNHHQDDENQDGKQ